MELRNYQKDLLSITRQSFKEYKRVLTVAPCGAGKTIMFAYMCQRHIEINPNGYVWFLVHRQELIDQTIKSFDNNGIDRSRVLIGMVQTVTRHIDKYNKPTMIVFDEAHHSSAKMWLNIIDNFPTVPIIGLTATPCRLDGKPLGNIYQDMKIGVTAKWLIENKYLSPYRYFAPKLNLIDSQFKIKGSDYDQKDVAEKFDKQAIYGDVLKYIDLSRKTIVYAPNINFSIKLSQEINNFFKTRICEHFDGDTPDKERKRIIEDFRSGKIRILTNVDLIGEGFDVPDCDCCMLLRPTMSVSLYIQQSMRCMRYQENKEAIIYDFVGNVFKHGLPDDEREWSLNKITRMRNTSDDNELIVRECKHCHRVYKGNSRICPYCGKDNGKTKTQIEQDRKAELEEIKSIEKKKERIEVGRARTLEELIKIGRDRGYKNPVYWAKMVLNNRRRRL